MTRTHKAEIAVLTIACCLVIGVLGRVGWGSYQRWAAKPLGAALPTSPYERIPLPPTWTPTAARPLRRSTPIVAPSPAPLCGGPPTMSLLLIGSDTRSSGYTWGLSDVMRVVRVDFVTPRLSLLDFPRDLWVEIPFIADNLNGQDHEKLNQAYLYGNPGDGFAYWDDPSAGPGLLARTLDLNFGAKVDHYLAVNMQSFVRMVDAVGGLDINLPRRIGSSRDPSLQKGFQHLDGAQALAVARDRTEGVFSRGEEQNLVLCALQKKLNDPTIVVHIPDIVHSFQGSVQTDLSPAEMGQLACLATLLPRSNIALYNFPEGLFTGARIYDPVFHKNVFVWDVDFNVLRRYVAMFQMGSWPLSMGAPGKLAGASFCQ